MRLDDHNRLLAQLKVDEGFRSSVYFDSLGFATIGYGRLVDHRKGGGITEEEGEYLLNNDLYKVLRDLSGYPWYLDQESGRQMALANMGFNLGVANLVREWPHFIAHIEARDYPAAVAAITNTPWHRQVGARADRIIQQLAGVST